MLEQVSKKYVLTWCVSVFRFGLIFFCCCCFGIFFYFFLFLAACLKPLRDCALFDSYSEPLPSTQQTRDFTRAEVRSCELGPYLSEGRGLHQLHRDCALWAAGLWVSERTLGVSKLRIKLSQTPSSAIASVYGMADRLFKRYSHITEFPVVIEGLERCWNLQRNGLHLLVSCRAAAGGAVGHMDHVQVRYVLSLNWLKIWGFSIDLKS